MNKKETILEKVNTLKHTPFLRDMIPPYLIV